MPTTPNLAAWDGVFDEGDVTTVFYSPETRAAWPDPLAQHWLSSYPCLFDTDDLRLTVTQQNNHFGEWLAAISCHHAHGVHALLEKYHFSSKAHPRKAALLEPIVGQEAAAVIRSLQGQPPDLLLFEPDGSDWWFAEVKQRGEKPAPHQPTDFQRLRDELGVPIKLLITEQTAASSISQDAP